MAGMELPTPNLPALRKAIDWATAEAQKPEDECQWDQSWWMTEGEYECGTTYCIAGYVVSSDPGFQRGAPYEGAVVDGRHGGWSMHAERILGITADEADLLFSGDNHITDVRRIAERIAERAGERL